MGSTLKLEDLTWWLTDMDRTVSMDDLAYWIIEEILAEERNEGMLTVKFMGWQYWRLMELGYHMEYRFLEAGIECAAMRRRAHDQKHFIKLVEYLKNTEPYCEPFTAKQLEHIANFCHSVNPNFNRERWFDFIAGRCGPNGRKQ